MHPTRTFGCYKHTGRFKEVETAIIVEIWQLLKRKLAFFCIITLLTNTVENVILVSHFTPSEYWKKWRTFYKVIECLWSEKCPFLSFLAVQKTKIKKVGNTSFYLIVYYYQRNGANFRHMILRGPKKISGFRIFKKKIKCLKSSRQW